METTWKKIHFNAQNIKVETAKAVLIKMPNNSSYPNHTFWHPKKLVRNVGGKGFFLTFSFTDNFEFKLTKTSKNGTVLSEVCLDSEEMIEAWNSSDSSIRPSVENDQSHFLEVHEPIKIDKEVTIDESLLK